jgi:hypothetical protein
VEEGEEEVDDVDGREEDVDDEVAGMKILEYSTRGYIQNTSFSS